MADQVPSANGSNGRNAQGRFVAGNSGGPGNPHAQRVAAVRAALMEAVTDEDLRQIVQALVLKAKGGDTMAAREILDRLLGKAKQEVQMGGGLALQHLQDITGLVAVALDGSGFSRGSRLRELMAGSGTSQPPQESPQGVGQ